MLLRRCGCVTLLRCTVDDVMQVWMSGGVTLLRCTVDVGMQLWRCDIVEVYY